MSDLHSAIMNIPCVAPKDANINQAVSYRVGHRDARHAAAELALATHAGAAAEPSDAQIMDCFFKTTAEGQGAYMIDVGRAILALTSAPAEPWVTQMAEQANLIDRDRLEKWLLAYGISTGEGRERFSALVGQYVNDLTREEPFSAPAQTPQAAGAIDVWGQEVTLTDTQIDALFDPRDGIMQGLDEMARRFARRVESFLKAASPMEAPPAAGAALAVADESLHPVRQFSMIGKLGKRLAEMLDEDQWAECEEILLAIENGPWSSRALAATPAPEVGKTVKRLCGALVDVTRDKSYESLKERTRESVNAALKAAHPGERKELLGE